MLKLSVIKNNQVVHNTAGQTEQECLAQLQPYFEHKTFGEPAREETALVSEAVPEVRDEEGNVIQEAVEAVYETKVIPADYEIEVENITQQVALEKSKQEEKRLAKEKRKADRKAIDFDKINTVKELKAYLKLYFEDLEG